MMIKRFISAVLAAVFLILMPTGSFAEENQGYITVYHPLEGEVFGNFFATDDSPGVAWMLLYYETNLNDVTYTLIAPDGSELAFTYDGGPDRPTRTYKGGSPLRSIYKTPKTNEEMAGEYTVILSSKRGDMSVEIPFYYDPEISTTQMVIDALNDTDLTKGVTYRAGGGTQASSSGAVKVESIEVDPKEVEVELGESKEIKVTSAASLNVEIEDESVIDASLSNGVLTVTGKKTGKSAVWLRSSENYMNVDVTVVPAAEKQQTGIKDILKKIFEALGAIIK